jgi:hypothetical protein
MYGLSSLAGSHLSISRVREPIWGIPSVMRRVILKVPGFFAGQEGAVDKRKRTRAQRRIRGIAAMRRFRDNGGLSARPGLVWWWELGAKHRAEFTILLARDVRLQRHTAFLLEEIGPLLDEPDRPVSKDFLAHAGHTLAELLKVGSPELRVDAARVVMALRKVIGLTAAEALDVLSEEARRN